MDFITGLPRTPQGLDAIWVVDDRLTKIVHFIPIRVDYPVNKLTQLYVQEVVRLHRVPESIVSDRDPRLQSRLWKSLSEAMGTKLQLSTTAHP